MSGSGSSGTARDYLIDVSRLIWRAWRGRPATGIDRVCLAYLQKFAARSQAVVQRRGMINALSPHQSDRLFSLLAKGSEAPRIKLAARLAAALPTGRVSPLRQGMIYLNVGHTGLDSPSLPRWISRYRTRAVYFLHDLIPVTHPQFCREGESTKHALRITHALESGSGIIANSEDTLRELELFSSGLGLTLPPSIAAWISGYAGPKDVTAASLPQPYFVTVGTIEGRKNHLTLLRAWEQLVAQSGSAAPILVIIGNRGWKAEDTIRRLDHLGSLAGHVREISSCTDEELAGWIAGARALLMPSFVEGFGLPIIEALKLGTPVIASDLPVYREIVAEMPTYLDATDSSAWSQTAQAFMRDSPERQRKLAVIEQYRAPSWDDHFHRVERWLNEL